MADKPLAEKARDWDREPDDRDQDMPELVEARTSEPDRVEVDTLIERPDLGPESSTFIAAGDVVPRELAGLPRRPASEPTAKAKRR
jgi:hypothetical protein